MTVSISPMRDRLPELLQGKHQASDSSSDSMAASSSAEPCTLGPVNHLRAETSH